jgi:hypothetical protein
MVLVGTIASQQGIDPPPKIKPNVHPNPPTPAQQKDKHETVAKENSHNIANTQSVDAEKQKPLVDVKVKETVNENHQTINNDQTKTVEKPTPRNEQPRAVDTKNNGADNTQDSSNVPVEENNIPPTGNPETPAESARKSEENVMKDLEESMDAVLDVLEKEFEDLEKGFDEKEEVSCISYLLYYSDLEHHFCLQKPVILYSSW